MFATALRRVSNTCGKLIVRNVRGRPHNITSGPNPGLDKRIQAFQKDGFQITDEDAEEFVDQSESDFYKVGDYYDAHKNETKTNQDKLQSYIVKEKYFKENMPNLLTWSEKEQIRHLAQEHPEEWTPERLAESFPVTVPVVKKLLKFVWRPASKERIARHDHSAMRNWKDLKDGTLDVPENLRQHFLKFSNRTIPPLDEKSIAKTEYIKEDHIGEFEKIIKQCAAQEKAPEVADLNKTNIDSEKCEEKPDTKVRKDSKFVTLDELTGKIKKRLETGQKVDIPDKLIVNSMDSKKELSVDNINTEIELSEDVAAENKLTAFKDEEDKVLNVTTYPERIRIPKKAYKKGATYRVNDCFYDHDGKFLYRVLGIIDTK